MRQMSFFFWPLRDHHHLIPRTINVFHFELKVRKEGGSQIHCFYYVIQTPFQRERKQKKQNDEASTSVYVSSRNIGKGSKLSSTKRKRDLPASYKNIMKKDRYSAEQDVKRQIFPPKSLGGYTFSIELDGSILGIGGFCIIKSALVRLKINGINLSAEFAIEL
ncbi:hypothetical protein BDC45DRAFT_538314 [Circinella umbellata]|nr:hypothetical protein BDC45DRAFT_538314 [Circinella umbellata]